ncbi:TPA: hypothetical protein NPN46_002919 [Klebsiella pneumoniae]|uniref:hypothetical protein n=1 Tax=Klebsiella pneumoniae complex TaxID=3390273 RepID=UPI0007CC1957|nr:MULTISPECIES: hypothetical protein [Klebsiella]ELA1012766.1 hypothetical protein [Klebsiella pneumoniae]MCB3516328.1 hypothetical protein [Klebsiella pneumoniae]MCB3639657.1 hypothetical protein [Klebsiella pneumoniae]MCJ6247241.1 hypothetical protein [Klebsiella pneumoniae]MCR8552017.1 hypothetical protein [Klebsiella quasipneumoniae]
MSAAAKTKNYDVVPTSVRRMTKLHTPAGDIKFTPLMKLIYSYIWTFQGNENRGNDDPIHTNTNVIAWEMGISERALIDALNALDAARVVIKGTVKVRGNVNSSNYVAIPPASVVTLGVTPPSPGKRKVIKKGKKTDEKAAEAATQAEQAPSTATPSTDAPAGTPADQSPDLASESATSTAGQRYSVESDNDRSSDDLTNGGHEMSQDEQECQEYNDDPPFPREKPEPEETAGRVIAPLDDLRHWSYVGDDGLANYGVIWGVSGAGLDNLIGEHLKIREAEAEKNFKSQRAH